MSLLRLPTLYGQKISSLNKSLPSSLQKEGRQVISLPIADSRDVDTKGSAVGKFLAANPVGSLIGSKPVKYEKITTQLRIWFAAEEDIESFDFGRVVDIRLIVISNLTAPDVLWWCSEDGTKLVEYTALGSYTVMARGQVFCFKKTGTTAIGLLAAHTFY